VRIKSLVIFTVSALVIGFGFWSIWGHDLRYNVYANDQFSYDEPFSASGRIMISCLFGAAGGGIVCLVIFVLPQLVRRHLWKE
jgi:hypothetical protein